LKNSSRKKLNLFDATMLVMGGIIGVGIFFTPSGVAASIPVFGPYMAMWVLGGVIAIGGALTFAKLGALYPREGGWFVYLREAYGPFPAFLFAWIVLFVVSTGALAVMAHFCTSMTLTALQLSIEAGDPLRTVIELGFIIALTALALCGVKTSAWVQNGFMLVKLGAIGAFVGAGVLFLEAPETQVVVSGILPEGTSTASAMMSAALPVLFSYGGWQMLGYTASEVKDPERTLPRAIVLGVCGVIVIYLLINLAFVRTLGLPAMAELGGEFAAEAATRALGTGAGRLLSGAMAISAIGVLIVTVVATPWIYVAMAREKLFFARFAELHSKTGAPTLGLLLQLTLASTYLLALRGEVIDVLTGSVVFVEWIFHALVAFAVFRLAKQTGTTLKTPTRVGAGLYLGFALLVVGGTLAQAEPKRISLGLIVIAIGALIYWPWTRWMRLNSR